MDAAAVDYPRIRDVSSVDVPSAWLQAGLDLDAWRSFLRTGLDYVVRANSVPGST